MCWANDQGRNGTYGKGVGRESSVTRALIQLMGIRRIVKE
jgi:hypothetical protein